MISNHVNMNLKHLSLLWLVLGMVFSLSAQTPNCYRIYLSDKNNTPYSIDNPSEFLSQRAVDKRTRFSIPITEQDLPVNPQYKQQILALHPQMQLLAVSKWLNTIVVYCTNSSIVQQITSLPFVDSVVAIGSTSLQNNPSASIPENPMPMVQNVPLSTRDDINYGDGYGQIAIHNGHLLHAEGFRGEGMLIAVIDAGFKEIEQNSFYQKMVNEGRLVGRYSLRPNFLDQSYLNGTRHGMRVTSVMAADENGSFVGTAPKASYALIHSECAETEQPFEEDFWINAAEIADSLGADVINSSNGYTVFDNYPQGSHTYADFDGHTSIISRCASLLGDKGIITCNSAGNRGNSSWYFISAPADAFNILAVGACYSDSTIAHFSSHGPTYDGRVKPDVTSMGGYVNVYYYANEVYSESGTSFSSPIIAGLSACLWQAMPQYSSTEMMQIIRESSHLYNNPNTEYGYGIPDFYKAYTTHVGINEYKPQTLSIYPNPVTDQLHIVNPDGNIQTVSVYNASGQLVLQTAVPHSPILEIPVTNLPNGFYIGTATLNNHQTATFKFMK